jgi:uncharacterized protein YqeY
MSLLETIKKDFISAYKNKELQKKDFLGLLKSDIETNRLNGEEPTDVNVSKVLKKYKKNIESNIRLGIESTSFELEIIESYLPKLMSNAELMSVISEILIKENIHDKSQMGLVMNELKEGYDGKYDGKTASILIMDFFKKLNE